MDCILLKLDKEDTILVSPIDAFVNGKCICARLGMILILHTAKPVFNVVSGKWAAFNPLAWRHRQRVVGNKENSLMQMVLDVLSTPGTCVLHHW